MKTKIKFVTSVSFELRSEKERETQKKGHIKAKSIIQWRNPNNEKLNILNILRRRKLKGT